MIKNMNNFDRNIISEINTNGFCKIDNFFRDEDLKAIDLKLKKIKDKKIIKGDRVGYFPVDFKSFVINLLKLILAYLLPNYKSKYSHQALLTTLDSLHH